VNDTKLISPPSVGSPFWTASIALFSFFSVVFAFFWPHFLVAEERSHLHNPTVTGGMALLLTGATYGAVEVVRQFRRRPPYIHLSLSTLVVVAVFICGGLLITNGFMMRKRSPVTSTLVELHVIDDAINHPAEKPTTESK
jgi:heme A synthase